MPPSARVCIALGAFSVAAAIGLDAWHSHGLRESLEPEAHEAFARGLRIHYVAAFGLILAGLLMDRRPNRLGLAAALALGLGGLLFCGEVYRGALGQQTWGLAPKGGMLSILGWLLMAVSCALPKPPPRA